MDTRNISGSMMSGPDFYLTIASGWEPVDVVIGTAARTVGAGGFLNAIFSLMRKGHVAAVGEVSREVREIAYENAKTQACKLGDDIERIFVHEFITQNYTGVQITTCIATACRRAPGGFRALNMAVG